MTAPPIFSDRIDPGVPEELVRDKSIASLAERWAYLDMTRMVAAISIILLHADGSLPGYLGRFAVPFFAASGAFLVVLSQSRRPGQPFMSFAKKRAARLLGPFFVWTLIYAVVRQIGSGLTENITPPTFSFAVLWTGTTHHLWFLPFMFSLSLIAFGVAMIAPRFPRFVAVLMIALAMALLFIACPFPGTAAWYTFRLSYAALPAAFAAMAYAITWLYVPDWRLTPSLWYLLAGGICIWMVGLSEGGRSIVFENLAGFVLLLFSLVPAASKRSTNFQWPLEMPYGIYLSHVIFLEGLEDLFRINMIPPSFATEMFSFIAASILSIGFVYLALRLRLKVLVGG